MPAPRAILARTSESPLPRTPKKGTTSACLRETHFALLSARPRESGDPGRKKLSQNIAALDPRFRGGERLKLSLRPLPFHRLLRARRNAGHQARRIRGAFGRLAHGARRGLREFLCRLLHFFTEDLGVLRQNLRLPGHELA